MTKGKTHLIAKNEHTNLAKNYRPITCLNNIYKVLTKIISERLYTHLNKNNLFPSEQKGCVKNTYGCKDHLLTSKTIHKDCKETRKNLSIAWIDYQKAFDSIPHSWLLETMNIYRAPSTLMSFISKTITMWNTDLNLTYGKSETTTITIKDIKIQNGIYQDDSLSPLLFCVALFPLTAMLGRTNTGYLCKNEKQEVNHLLYIDDLKLIAKSDKELKTQLKIVQQFSDDIQMQFGLDKCAKATFLDGRLQSSENIEINDTTTIRALEQHDVYKYLGINEHDGIQHKNMKKQLTKEYYRRTREILKSQLNAKNTSTAITSLAVPIIQYSFGIIKWTLAELRKIDQQTRKLMNMHGALHPRADIDRLYIPRKDGGRGMQNIEANHNLANIGLNNYLELKQSDKFLGMVYRQLKGHIDKEDVKTNQQDHITNVEQSETKQVKNLKEKVKERYKEEIITKWREKALYGQIKKEVEKETINKEMTWKWLTHTNLKKETEALITACQEQAIATNYMMVKIMKSDKDPKCRLCRSQNETIHHIVAGCPILAPKAYLDRRNAVAALLHWNMCKKYKIKVKEKWYQHIPDPVIDTPEITIIWDTQVQTDRTIKANKPDIILKDKVKKECLIIDVAIPSDHNITEKEAEKRLKYKDLLIEIQRMWDLKAKIIPIIIGATGLISKATCEIIKLVPGDHNLLQMQKAVVLNTAHIVRKVLE